MGEQVVEDVGVQNEPVRQLLAKLVALDPFAVLLPLVEVKRVLLGFFVPFERTTHSIRKLFVIGQNRPAIRNGRCCVTVDDVVPDHDFGETCKETINTFFAAELVPDRLDAIHSSIILRHSSSSPI